MNKPLYSALVVGAVLLGLFTPSHTAQALTVSPVRIELSGDPGENLVSDIVLLNEQDKSMTFYFSAENFEAQGEDGTPNFVPGITDLASWITLLPAVEGEDPNIVNLGPQETVSRTFSVTIPEDATPGGHFAAIFFADTPPSDSGSVAVGAKVGILVLLTVSGEFEESGDLLSFNTKDEQSFFESLPVRFEYRFQNEGGDRVVPQGEIQITNLFGMTKEDLSINAAQNNVLPQSIRKYEETWGEAIVLEEGELEPGFWTTVGHQWENFAFGPYTATLNLVYGTDDTEVESAVRFWVVPWHLLIVCALSGIFVLVLFTFIIRHYNHWIIAQAVLARRNGQVSRTASPKKALPKKTTSKKSPPKKKRT